MKKEIIISSNLENLCKVERLIDEVSEKCNLNSDIYGKVLVATVEAVNNSIVHGNKFIAEKEVIISILLQGSKLHIFVKDEGVGFDYDNVPDPTTPENIENISGRGVFLMKHLADSIVFYGNGSQIELIFNL
ncbi:MAG: ATP-binding protein [Bacteroidales bacterium]|nr:ATP-binding protein [Bacteroidales bacterium]MBN2750045.1 ATP-binding protein [Bacteroidales bacterium]